MNGTFTMGTGKTGGKDGMMEKGAPSLMQPEVDGRLGGHQYPEWLWNEFQTAYPLRRAGAGQPGPLAGVLFCVK